MILSIDTSTRVASIALLDNGQTLAELTWRSEHHHTRELLPNLTHLLRQAIGDPASSQGSDDFGRPSGLEPVTGLAVAIGPGSFNGLRVGVSTAKALAVALGQPVVGISTLAAQAYQHAWYGRPVCSILGAGRTEVAFAIYELVGDAWIEHQPPRHSRLEDVLETMVQPTIFCGELTEPQIALIRSRLADRATVMPPVASLRRSGYLAVLGERLLESGRADDPASLQPLYLRRPPISERKAK